MSGEVLAQIGTVGVSLLALVLSLANLYLQRRDRRPRLKIRVRYEYRVEGPDAKDEGLPHVHDDSQEGLYMRLGDFLRQHGLRYPRGAPVVRFALSNEGGRSVYLEGVYLVLPSGRRGSDRVLDLAEGRVIEREFAARTANVLLSGSRDKAPVEIVPGDGVGYRFGLIRLADALREGGLERNVELLFEATDRLGNSYSRPFEIDTGLCTRPDER